jgi:hypothetical protein
VSPDARLDIPRPRVIWADRGDPDAVSAGDQACLSLAPGLLRFLEADLGAGLTPGAGFAPRWVLPLTAAASACYYLGSPRGREGLNRWTATRVRLSWTRACGDGETVEACARVARIGRASIRFGWRVFSTERRDLMAEGELVLLSRGPEGTVPPVLRLRPRADGDAARATAPPLAAAATAESAPCEIYYVRHESRGGERELATATDELIALAGTLPGDGRCDDLAARPGQGGTASNVDALAALARRLPRGDESGVWVIRAAEIGEESGQHVACVRALHPQVRVVGAGEALRAFLDYQTPVPLGVALPPSHSRGDGRRWVHPIRILGRRIPVGPGQPHRVRVAVTWWEPGDVRELVVRRDGALVAWRAPSAHEPPSIEFTAEGHAGYELAVELHPCALQRHPRRVPAWPCFSGRGDADGERFLEWPREPEGLLARFEPPLLVHSWRARTDAATPGDCWSWVFPPGLLRLLYSPIAGGVEPLGRRAHPLGGIAAAAIVHAALEGLGGGWQPQRLGIRWRRTIDPQRGFLLNLRVARCAAGEVHMESRLEQPPAALADVTLTLRAGGA